MDEYFIFINNTFINVCIIYTIKIINVIAQLGKEMGGPFCFTVLPLRHRKRGLKTLLT